MVAIGLVLALFEIGARVVLRIHFDSKYRKILSHYDDPTAKQMGRFSIEETFGDIEYHPIYHWVWKGGTRFRGRGIIDPVKRKNLFRIITLGDSCTWGVLVDEAQTYSSVLEKLLSERYGDQVEIEVLNGGILGFSSLQQLRYLTHDLAPYKPDLVIARGNWDDSPLGDDPYMVEKEFESVTFLKRLLAKSKAFYFLKYITIKGKIRLFEKKEPFKGEDIVTNWHLMADLAERRNYDLLIVEYHFKNNRRITVDQVNRIAKWPAPYIFVHDAYLKSGLSADEYIFDEVHPTAAGHKIIARQINNEIVELKIIDKWIEKNSLKD